MRAAVEHVQHRHRQHVRVRAADVAVQREPVLLRDGLGRRERHAEHRVGAEARLVVGAVERDEHRVEAALVGGVDADDGVADLARSRGRRPGRRPCRRSASSPSRSSTASCAPVLAPLGTAARPRAPEIELDLDLDGGVAAGVEDLPADDVLDERHCTLLLLLTVWRL